MTAALILAAGLASADPAPPAVTYEVVVDRAPRIPSFFTIETAAGPLPKLEAELLKGWKPSADGSDPLDRLVPDGRLLRVETAAPCPYSGPLTATICRALDKDGDGLLRPDEFQDAAARLLKAFDVDADGCLTPLEIVPDLVHAKPAAVKALAAKISPPGTREVKLLGGEPNPIRVRFEERMFWWVDGPGWLIHMAWVPAEPGAAPEVPKSLSKPGREAEKARFEKGAAAVVTVTVRPQPIGWFALLDTDGDGRLSLRELRNTQRMIGGWESRSAAFAKLPNGAVAPPDFAGGTAVSLTFAPGVRTPPPVQLNPAPRPGRGPEWFRALDRNADGDLSRAEFVGTNAEFTLYDADNDGLIAAAEAEAGDRKLSKGAKP